MQLRLRRQLAADVPSRYRLDSGDEFLLHSGDKLSELIFTGRDYEPVESGFCRRYLQAGDVAFDVGANVGYFTALFSRCVGAAGSVVALEPGSHTHKLLLQTVQDLGLLNVVVMPVALWHRSEVLAFHASTTGDDAQQSVARRAKQGSHVEMQPVAAVSFADLVASQWFDARSTPALLKVDVEGAETQVVEGMTSYLDAHRAEAPVLLMECNAEALRAAGNDTDALLRRLQDWYELFATPLCWPPWHAGETRFQPLQVQGPLPDSTELNLLAVPRRGPLRERALRAIG